MTGVRVHNVFNDFIMLANTQFIENVSIMLVNTQFIENVSS